jgi:putative radical SAM enzyme (TIGR03279 family)
MLRIDSVTPYSIAAELGVEAGDNLISVNARPVKDVVDYHRLTLRDYHLLIEVEKSGGDTWELDIEYEADQVLGFEFRHPQPRSCRNNCRFCFVRQLPRGMRDSLYVRDDDYRFSYLYGAYITLTNLQRSDIERIKKEKLSPLYVSVHSTDAQVRAGLLGLPENRTDHLMPLLQELAQAGIEIHTQVVLCPGINDAEVLEQTITDLTSLYPAVKSLAVVPVGLTRYRQGLPHLHMFDCFLAREVLDQIERWQEHCLARMSTRFVFSADELYLQAQRPFPPYSAYEDFCQIENGVGLIAQFEHQSLEVLSETEARFCSGVRATLVCGVSAYNILESFVHRFNRKARAALQLHPVTNRFWGESVSVSGLLTGQDIIDSLKAAREQGFNPGGAILLPEVMFKDDSDILLDDMDIFMLEEQLGVEVRKIGANPWAVLDAVEELHACCAS